MSRVFPKTNAHRTLKRQRCVTTHSHTLSSIDLTRARLIVCTCDGGQERACAHELLAWLEESYQQFQAEDTSVASSTPLSALSGSAADSKAQVKAEAEIKVKEGTESQGKSVAAALQEELNELRSDSSVSDSSPFCALDSETRGVALIQVRERALDHGHLLCRMLRTLKTSGHARSRFAIRVQVVHRACFAKQDDLIVAARSVIAEQLNDQVPNLSYAIIINRRSQHDGMDRDEIIKQIAEIVPERFKVELTHPEVCVCVEINKRMAGVGVMFNYTQLESWHVRAINEKFARKNAGSAPIQSTNQSKSNLIESKDVIE